MEKIHRPVLLEEVIEFLGPVDGGIFIDGNLGLGGHAERILLKSAPNGKVIGFDWDAAALDLARERLAPFGSRILFMHRNYAEMREALEETGIREVDGVLLDLGLSSLQLEKSSRGFSFLGSEHLDMRMDVRTRASAADLVNKCTKDELADIFYNFGEERQARRIAAAIIDERRKNRIETTDQLVEIVARSIPRRFHPKKIHVATKVFQGLRIAVNRELDNLQTALSVGAGLLKPGGRFCVISFHSLEDRLVKNSFRDNSCLKTLTRKPVIPGAEELKANPRARSAKMRVAVRER